MTTQTSANPGYGPTITEAIPSRLASALAASGQALTDLGGVPLSVPDRNLDSLVSAKAHVRAAHAEIVRALTALDRVEQDHPSRHFADQEFVALTALKNRMVGSLEAMDNRGVRS